MIFDKNVKTLQASNEGLRGSYNIHDPNIPLAVQFSDVGRYGQPDMKPVSAREALEILPLQNAIELISSAVVGLPVMQIAKDKITRKVPAFWERPSTILPAEDFWQAVIANYLIYGNSYIYIVRDTNGMPVDLEIINPKYVEIQITKTGRGGTQGYAYKINPRDDHREIKEQTIHSMDMIRVSRTGLDGIVGISPLEKNQRTLRTIIEAEKYAANLWLQGGMMSGLLTTDAYLTDTQANTLKNRWEQKNHGTFNAHRVAVLGQGMNYERIALTPQESQILDIRKYSLEEICRMFLIPLPILSNSVSSASTVLEGKEEDIIKFAEYCIKPICRKIAKQLQTHFCKRSEIVEFNIDKLIKINTRERASASIQFRKSGTMTINESRLAEGLPPVDDERADDVFYAFDMAKGGAQEIGENAGNVASPEAAETPTEDTDMNSSIE